MWLLFRFLFMYTRGGIYAAAVFYCANIVLFKVLHKII